MVFLKISLISFSDTGSPCCYCTRTDRSHPCRRSRHRGYTAAGNAQYFRAREELAGPSPHPNLPCILPHSSAVTIPFRAIAPAYTIAINPGSIPLPSLYRAKIPINQGFLAKITPNNRQLLPPMQRAARAFFVADPASGRLKQARDQNSPIYGGQNPGAL